MSTLQQYYALIDRFLTQCRENLTPKQWQAFTHRLKVTPIAQHYAVEEQPTPWELATYWYDKLDDWQKEAFLREQRNACRREREEGEPCS